LFSIEFNKIYARILRALQNLTIFIIQEKRVDFSEVTGARALSFRNLSVGEIPPEEGRGVKLPHA